MTKKALILAGALLLPALGIAQPSGWEVLLKNATTLKQVDASECAPTSPSGTCVASITVGEGCSIRVSPEYMYIRTKVRPVMVLWKVEPSTWAFQEKIGIKFKTTQTQFTDGRKLSPQVWQVRDRNDKNGYFNYTVNLVSDKGEKCSLDPGLWNDSPTGG
jgi:hypothetical protein